MGHLHANMWRPNRDVEERALRVRSPALHVNAHPQSRGTISGILAITTPKTRADAKLRKFSWESE